MSEAAAVASESRGGGGNESSGVLGVEEAAGAASRAVVVLDDDGKKAAAVARPPSRDDGRSSSQGRESVLEGGVGGVRLLERQDSGDGSCCSSSRSSEASGSEASGSATTTCCLGQKELREARDRARIAETSLNRLSQGLRMLARQIKQADYNGGGGDNSEEGGEEDDDDNVDDARTEATDCETICSAAMCDHLLSSSSSSCSRTSTASASGKGQRRDFSDWILSELVGCDCEAGTAAAADWMSLQNAVRMLQEHVRLASEEAAHAQTAQVDAELWRERAETASAANKDLESENDEMRSQITRLSTERRVLVKEVKSLRKRLDEECKRDRCRQMEQYMVGALSMDERQLAEATATAGSRRRCHSDDDDTASVLTVEQQQDAAKPSNAPAGTRDEPISAEESSQKDDAVPVLVGDKGDASAAASSFASPLRRSSGLRWGAAVMRAAADLPHNAGIKVVPPSSADDVGDKVTPTKLNERFALRVKNLLSGGPGNGATPPPPTSRENDGTCHQQPILVKSQLSHSESEDFDALVVVETSSETRVSSLECGEDEDGGRDRGRREGNGASFSISVPEHIAFQQRQRDHGGEAPPTSSSSLLTPDSAPEALLAVEADGTDPLLAMPLPSAPVQGVGGGEVKEASGVGSAES